jgi:hypothetical protein
MTAETTTPITLATLAEATPQAIFDQVARHLLTQNAQSIRDDAGFDVACLYRGPDGLKCALGCLIADTEYVPDMEGHGIYGLIEAGYCDANIKPHAHFLAELQEIHDGHLLPETWPAQLRKVARHYALNIAVLGNFS